MGEKRGEVALIIGGLLMIVGMFMTFITVEGPGGSTSFNGQDAEEASPYFVAGVVSLLAAAALFAMKSATGRKVVAGLAIAIVAFFGAYAAFTDITEIGDLSSGGIEASAGIGLYIAALGSIVALAGAIMALMAAPRTEVVTTPTTPTTQPPA